MNEKLERTPSLRAINTANRKVYDAAALEYDKRETEEGFSMKNDPILVAALLKHIEEGFPDIEHSKLAILDVGPGAGVNLRMFADAGFETHGIDISAKMLDVAKKRSPDTHYHSGDFLQYPLPRKFHGIMAKAFIHLFPANIALQMVEKMRDSLETGGVLFLATTTHGISGEGWERKHDFQVELKRYRKRWTKEQFLEFLGSIKGLQIIERSDMEDPSGKPWMNFTLRKLPDRSSK
jgi:SAM-dependent methyltransferase